MQKCDDDKQLLEQYVSILFEKRLREREVETTNGARVKFGSTKHISDLEARIRDLVVWRDRQKKGTEARANYARLIQKLKAELNAAKKVASKKTLEK